MPIYQYTNLRTGKVEEHFATVARRDVVPPHLKRITVPQSVGYANNSSLKEPGADEAVPRAFREIELSGVSHREIARKTGFSREHIRRVWDF